jgi:hypothetical protein
MYHQGGDAPVDSQSQSTIEELLELGGAREPNETANFHEQASGGDYGDWFAGDKELVRIEPRIDPIQVEIKRYDLPPQRVPANLGMMVLTLSLPGGEDGDPDGWNLMPRGIDLLLYRS